MCVYFGDKIKINISLTFHAPLRRVINKQKLEIDITIKTKTAKRYFFIKHAKNCVSGGVIERVQVFGR